MCAIGRERGETEPRCEGRRIWAVGGAQGCLLRSSASGTSATDFKMGVHKGVCPCEHVCA